MKKSIADILLFVISAVLIFNYIPYFFRSKFIVGVLSAHLVVYPLIIWIVYTLYCQYKYKNVFVSFGKFRKFLALYICIHIVSALWGAYIYPYYDVALNTPIEQIPKLDKLLKFVNSMGLVIDDKFAIKLWLVAKPLKSVFIDTLYTFGGAYMVYCWYYNDWQKGIMVIIKGLLVGVCIVCACSVIEVFYLADNVTAKHILEFITPYFHPIKIRQDWWPPLLWKGQLRSVFPEPSHIGNYIALSMPVLWYLYLRNESKRILYLSCMLTFFVFLTNARTAYAMLFGMLVLLPMLLIYAKRVDLLKKTICIFFACAVAFGMNIAFVNYQSSIKTVTAVESLDKNLVSLASSDKRSNGARYGLIKANLRIAADYPILGVGSGLSSAYIIDYFTENEKKNREINSWVKNQNRNGVLSMNYSVNDAMNEYVTRIAQNGVLGLSIFLFPFILVIVKLFKLVRYYKGNKQLDVLLILFTLINCMVAGCNGSLNLIYSVWLILGIAYAIVYSDKYCLIDDEEREN